MTSACSVVRVSANRLSYPSLRYHWISNTLLWELVLARLPDLEVPPALPANYVAIVVPWHCSMSSSSYAIHSMQYSYLRLDTCCDAASLGRPSSIHSCCDDVPHPCLLTALAQFVCSTGLFRWPLSRSFAVLPQPCGLCRLRVAP